MLALGAFVCGSMLGAQATAAPVRPVTSSVSGIVFDSLGRVPLAGAEVQLVNADNLSSAARTASSDSLGKYRIDGVPAGRYLVGFLHPVLDSLGVEPKPREVISDGRMPTRADLGLPSARSLRTALCGAAAVADSQALIIGFVRNASDRMAVDSAVVAVRWVDMVLEGTALRRSLEHRAVATQESGWYAVCGAPSGGTVMLTASHAADSTHGLELEVPKDGFLRRDLYFGAARLVPADVSAQADTTRIGGRRYAGDGRLTGTVVAATGGRALAGARVSLIDGPSTRTDERGAFTLSGVPTGTRLLEVRAVAHYPQTLPVDVVEGAGPVRVAMLTLQSVLDTVRVTAAKGGNRTLLDFNRRRKSAGAGRFIGSEDVALRNPTYTTDLFRSMPGIFLARDQNGEEVLVQRSNTFSSPTCAVSVFVNGMNLRGMSANDINQMVRPKEIIGIEVYSAGSAPPQYSEQNGCGSVVIWSR